MNKFGLSDTNQQRGRPYSIQQTSGGSRPRAKGGEQFFFEMLKQNWFANIACPAGFSSFCDFHYFIFVFQNKGGGGAGPPGPSPRSATADHEYLGTEWWITQTLETLKTQSCIDTVRKRCKVCYINFLLNLLHSNINKSVIKIRSGHFMNSVFIWTLVFIHVLLMLSGNLCAFVSSIFIKPTY